MSELHTSKHYKYLLNDKIKRKYVPNCFGINNMMTTVASIFMELYTSNYTVIGTK